MTPPPTARFIRIVARVLLSQCLKTLSREAGNPSELITMHLNQNSLVTNHSRPFYKAYDSTKFVPLFTISIPISCNVHPECRIRRKKLCNLRDATTNYYVCFAGQTLLSQFPNRHSCDTPNLSGQGVPCGQDISHAYTYLHCKKKHIDGHVTCVTAFSICLFCLAPKKEPTEN